MKKALWILGGIILTGLIIIAVVLFLFGNIGKSGSGKTRRPTATSTTVMNTETTPTVDIEDLRISTVTEAELSILLWSEQQLLDTEAAVSVELELELPIKMPRTELTVYGDNDTVLASLQPSQTAITLSVTIPGGVDSYCVWAEMGSYSSNVLTFRRNWQLTETAAAQLKEIMAAARSVYDTLATDPMDYNYAKDIAQQICTSLSSRQDVHSCWIEDNLSVYYETAEGLLACFNVNYTPESEDLRTAGYGDPAPENVCKKFSMDPNYRDVCTDPDVMLLLPLFTVPVLKRDGKSHESSAGKLASYLGGQLSVFSDKTDATLPLICLLSDQVTEVGTMALVTHGSSLPRDDGTRYLALTIAHFADIDTMYDQVWAVDDYCGIAASIPAYHESAPKSKYWSADLIYVYDADSKEYQLMVTSNAIMRCWGNLRFPNTVFYFGACHSIEDTTFNQFLTARGAACVFGYQGAAYIPAEKASFDALVQNLTEVPYENHSMTVLNAQEESYNLVAKLLHNTLSSLGGWFLQQECTVEVSLYGTYQFCLEGQGNFAGEVIGSNGQNLSGATVTAYRYWNGELLEEAQTQTDSDGQFRLDCVPWGMYMLVAEKEIAIGYTEVQLGHSTPNQEELILITHGERHVVDEGFTLTNGFIVPVEQKTSVPEGYIGVYSYADLVGIYESNAEANRIPGNVSELRNDQNNAKYILMNDIVCPADYETAFIFFGILDGNGYTISNVHKPLFYFLQDATIQNLGIELAVNSSEFQIPDITYSSFGGLAISGAISSSMSNTIDNCFSSGSLNIPENGTTVGGILCDNNSSTTIRNCYNCATITVYGQKYGGVSVGGIVGVGSVEKDCFNTGDISVTNAISPSVGGLVGSGSTSIKYCYNTGNITVDAVGEGPGLVGGIVGDGGNPISHMSISNCYNTGDITLRVQYPAEYARFFEANEKDIDSTFSKPYIAGGIMGGRNSVYITNCQNTGNIISKNAAGGILGIGRGISKVQNCTNTGTVAATDYTGDLIGKP